MTLEDQIASIAQVIARDYEILDNEEITKHSLVSPLVRALGWNTADPREVRPEYPVIIDGSRRRADYVIQHESKPVIVIECKVAGHARTRSYVGQLASYFNAIAPALGILTDGIGYAFYADAQQPGSMDAHAFYELNLAQELTANDYLALSMIAKDGFRRSNIKAQIAQLGPPAEQQIREAIEFDFQRPEHGLSRLAGFIAESKDGESLAEDIAVATKCFEAELTRAVNVVKGGGILGEEDGVLTLESEILVYNMVQALVADVIPPERIWFRDAKSYASVLVDDNNRKPICRLHLHGTKGYVGTIGADRSSTKREVSSVDDVIGLREYFREAAKRHR